MSDFQKLKMEPPSDEHFDQLEAHDLECYNPHKVKAENDVKEQILLEDDNMIVGQITSLDEYEVPKTANGDSIQTLHNYEIILRVKMNI